jgi:hypothetical protein
MEKIILILNTFALPSNSHIQNMERIIVQKPTKAAFFYIQAVLEQCEGVTLLIIYMKY